MSNEKTRLFFDEVEKRGLNPVFCKLTEIASEKLGCYLEDIIDDAISESERPVCRVRYQAYDDGTEKYIYETRKHDEDDWDFLCSYDLINDMLHFEALTQIRELIRTGYAICFQ